MPHVATTVALLSLDEVFATLTGKSMAIVVARNGSPLIIGVGDKEMHVASDLAAAEPRIAVTDLAVNVDFKIWKTLEIFLQPELSNVFNEDALTGGRIGQDSSTTVNTRASAGSAFQNFDPSTEPVEGTHYAYAANFGQAVGRDAYQLPRTFRFSVGLRF